MGGFFGFFDYSKPGPGVPKDAPPKARFFVFFEILSRKFWNLVKMNIMFSIFNIPAIIGVLFMSQVLIQKNIFENPGDNMLIQFILASVLMCIPVLTVGPAQAGFTYVLRNYAREEHAFLWWDFKETAIKNFKQSLVVSLIDFVVIFLVAIDINLYSSMQSNSILVSIASGFLILAFVIFLMMHLYIYPMMITFKLTVKQIYKNALLFAMIRFLPNLGILILCTLLIYASFYYPVIGFVLLFTITLSVIGFIINFYVYPSLKKYMIDKVEVQTAPVHPDNKIMRD